MTVCFSCQLINSRATTGGTINKRRWKTEEKWSNSGWNAQRSWWDLSDQHTFKFWWIFKKQRGRRAVAPLRSLINRCLQRVDPAPQVQTRVATISFMLADWPILTCEAQFIFISKDLKISQQWEVWLFFSTTDQAPPSDQAQPTAMSAVRWSLHCFSFCIQRHSDKNKYWPKLESAG